MKVRVIEGRQCYFNHKRRREGDVFVIPDKPIRKLSASELSGTYGAAFRSAATEIVVDGKGTGEFTIPQLFTARGMEVVSSDVPVRVTGATAHLKNIHDRTLAERVVAKQGGEDGVEIDENIGAPAGSNLEGGERTGARPAQDADVI